jgi:hypothetical protein
VVLATPELPYLGVLLELDLEEIATLMADASMPGPLAGEEACSVHIGHLDASLRDCLVRLSGLLSHPDEQAVPGPMARREILFRLADRGAAQPCAKPQFKAA